MAEMQKEHSGNHQADEDTAAVDRAIVAYEVDKRAHRWDNILDSNTIENIYLQRMGPHVY